MAHDMAANPYLPDFEATPAELLKIVNAAISQIVATGQEYRMGDRSLTRADLPELRKMRADLMAEVAAASTTSATNLADMRRRP